MEAENDIDDDVGDSAMVDTLRLLGVDEVEAVQFLYRIHQTKKSKVKKCSDAPATFVELYGGGSLCKEAYKSRRKLNIKGIGAFDLRTHKPDGTPWNFCKRVDRTQAKKFIDQKKPDWIIGSPPC